MLSILIIVFLKQGDLEVGRNWLSQKIEVLGLSWSEQNTEHA